MHLTGTSTVSRHTPHTLRAELVADVRSQAALWIKLQGIGVGDPLAHKAVCRQLAICFGEELSPIVPRTVVLDWSTVQTCTAEGLAFFMIVVRRLVEAKLRVFVCSSDRRDVAAAIESLALDGVEWVRMAFASTASLFSLEAAESVLLDSKIQDVSRFCDRLALAVSRYSDDRPLYSCAMGATMEAIQNIFEHAQASNATAVALIHTRKRPPALQIGFADDGRTIAMSIQDNPRYRWVESFDAPLTQAVLLGTRSSRQASLSAGEAKGGLGLLVQRILTQTTAKITLRSGRALISLDSADPNSPRLTRLDYGIGTQWLFELRLS